MKPLLAIISTFLLGILPLYSNASTSGNASELVSDTTINEYVGQEGTFFYDGWSDQRLKEYEDSLVNAHFPMPAIIEINPDSVKSGINKAPSAVSSDVLYGYAHIPDSRDIDTSCIVGDIPVTSGVSQTGARTYEIPLDVFPGVNGMQPKIAICYNSQSPNSVMGAGWYISGLSSITRGSKSVYHDGNTSAISMSAADAFFLDGIRLIKTAGTASPYTYKSEHGNIAAKQYFSGNITQYFEVFYPDGNMAVFGFKDNNANRISYPLTELSDLHGNTISYAYETFISNDICNIERITYNGNASINFTYASRKVPTLKFVAGTKVSQQYTLGSITAKIGSEITDKYLFSYTDHGAAPLLTRISRENGQGGRYNPIELYYGSGQAGEGWTNTQTQLARAYIVDGTTSVRVQRGRFDYLNGVDGLITLPYRPSYYHLHKNAGSFNHSENRFDNHYAGDEVILIHSNLVSSGGGIMPELKTETGFVDILCADLLGQQEEFIIKVNNTVDAGSDKVTFTTYHANAVTGLSKRHTRTFRFPTVLTDPKGNKSIQPKFYYTGDFNGDGKMEILAMSAHEPFGDTSRPSVCYIFDLEGNRILYKGSFLQLKKVFYSLSCTENDAENRSDKLVAMDIDGDGKTDLVHINEGSTDVYTFDISGTTFSPREVGWYSGLKTSHLHDRRILAGDFNGDGCADLFITPSYDSSTYPSYNTTYLSMGNGRFDRYSVVIDSPHDDKTDFLAQDINGDGMTDILKCSNGKLTAYLCKNGYISEAEGVEYQVPVMYCATVAADANTRNTLGQVLCLRNDKVFKLRWNTDEHTETLLSGLAGSLGTVEKTYYTRTDKLEVINGEQIYMPLQDAVFPYVNLLEPIPVVGATEFFLSGISLGRDHYSYTNAVMHRQGLGFAGFQTVRKVDARNRNTVNEFEPYRFGLPKSASSPTAQVSFSFSVKTAADKTRQFNLDRKTEKDLLSGYDVTSSYTYDSYGFPLTESEEWSDGIKKTVTNTYSHAASVGKGYLLGLIKKRAVSHSKTGYAATTDTRSVTEFNNGLPLSETVMIDGQAVVKKGYTYDGNGLKTSETSTPYSSSLALKKEFGYDAYGLLTSETDELGLKTEYTYDTKGRIIDKKDIRGGVTRYTYDAGGRQSSSIRPDSTEVKEDYKWLKGNKYGVFSVTRTETGRPQTENVFDAMGRCTWNSEKRFDGSRLYVYRNYDNFGNVTFESVPYTTTGTTSYGTKWTYDEYDRPLKCSGPGAMETTWSYSGATVTVKERGISTVKTYDSQKHLIKQSDPSGSLTYDLDATGNPRTITAPGNVRTTFTYDGFRRRKSMADPSQGSRSWSYDVAGNISEETDANGRTISYSYDSYNRLAKCVTPEFSTTYSYDSYGALNGKTSTNQTSVSYTYDGFGRVIREIEVAASRYSFRKEYSYSSGNVASIRYSVLAGSPFRTLGKESFTYSNGHLSEITLNDSKLIYRLDKETPFGQPQQITTGAIRRVFSYSGPIFESRRTVTANGDTLLDLASSFDAASSNLVSRTDRKSDITERFTYDALNRLKGYGGNTATYDIKGNLLSRSEIGTFSYGSGTKPYALTGVNTRSGIVPRSTQEISYTSFSRPARIEEDGVVAEFRYNANHDRVKMSLTPTASGVTTTTHYSGGNFESVYKSTSTTAFEERLYLGGDYYNATAVYVRKNYKWTFSR
ncbi:MAG: FG-GAP-like repeat-containing protein [Muribaculaceae bacterium]|nr:FG-GAP-like repeat-containing protein [Muribaculaceae bacterium]